MHYHVHVGYNTWKRHNNIATQNKTKTSKGHHAIITHNHHVIAREYSKLRKKITEFLVYFEQCGTSVQNALLAINYGLLVTFAYHMFQIQKDKKNSNMELLSFRLSC